MRHSNAAAGDALLGGFVFEGTGMDRSGHLGTGKR